MRDERPCGHRGTKTPDEFAPPHRPPGQRGIVAAQPGLVKSADRWIPKPAVGGGARDRKSTRLNSSHLGISYAVFCLKKKNNTKIALEIVKIIEDGATAKTRLDSRSGELTELVPTWTAPIEATAARRSDGDNNDRDLY